MTDEIRVSVSHYGPGRCLMLRWRDPVTRQRRTKSAGTDNKREAERKAGLLERELPAGNPANPGRMAWRDFCFRYLDEEAKGFSPKGRAAVKTVMNATERLAAPTRIGDLTASRISGFASKLRQEGKSEATIKSYLTTLRAMLAWAATVKLIRAVPDFPEIKRAKGSKVMKGRPVTTEEFERMLRAARKVVGKESAPFWRRLLIGLWRSGLRLGEALALTWDRPDAPRVDLTGRRPAVFIPGACQKSGRDELWAMPPEFARFLERVPEGDRHGRVLRLAGIVTKRPQGGGVGGAGNVSDVSWVGRVLTRIGKAAGVKVDERVKRDRGTGEPKTVAKWASAHDLRRAFGERWAARVMPQVLMAMMRHENIETTLRYYVGKNAMATADAAWEAWKRVAKERRPRAGNTSGNTPSK